MIASTCMHHVYLEEVMQRGEVGHVLLERVDGLGVGHGLDEA